MITIAWSFQQRSTKNWKRIHGSQPELHKKTLVFDHLSRYSFEGQIHPNLFGWTASCSICGSMEGDSCWNTFRLFEPLISQWVRYHFSRHPAETNSPWQVALLRGAACPNKKNKNIQRQCATHMAGYQRYGNNSSQWLWCEMIVEECSEWQNNSRGWNSDSDGEVKVGIGEVRLFRSEGIKLSLIFVGI